MLTVFHVDVSDQVHLVLGLERALLTLVNDRMLVVLSFDVKLQISYILRLIFTLPTPEDWSKLDVHQRDVSAEILLRFGLKFTVLTFANDRWDRSAAIVHSFNMFVEVLPSLGLKLTLVTFVDDGMLTVLYIDMSDQVYLMLSVEVTPITPKHWNIFTMLCCDVFIQVRLTF